MQCKKCAFNGIPTLTETGPHTKATCPDCGAYIKMASNKELSDIFTANPSMCLKEAEPEAEDTSSVLLLGTGAIKIGNTVIRFGARNYKYASDMIHAAIDAGYRHIGGPSLVCRHCKKSSTRKFTKDNKVVYCCHRCSACWN